MTTIGFIGLGNMGGPMARRLVKAGYDLHAFDISAPALGAVVEFGAKAAKSLRDVASSADIVITVLPAGQHVRSAYFDEDGILESAKAGAVLIDCSTIEVDSARAVSTAAGKAGLAFLDAPASGNVGDAEAGTLTFMCGGDEGDFGRARPILAAMGKDVILAGGAGAGQAAKVCNNMLLAISMIGTCEAFVLAEKLGLDPHKLFEIVSAASGQCWSVTSYCPVPGPVPASPANHDFAGGFATALMLKDLALAQAAAGSAGAATPLGAEAHQLYSLFANRGNAGLDFSGIIKMLRGEL